ncbi:hypothetical protein V8F06_010790 [Rhypophila decipiens]
MADGLILVGVLFVLVVLLFGCFVLLLLLLLLVGFGDNAQKSEILAMLHSDTSSKIAKVLFFFVQLNLVLAALFFWDISLAPLAF